MYELNLSTCNIQEDIGALGNVNSLYLCDVGSRGKSFKSISSLVWGLNMNAIDLGGCVEITDIGLLGHSQSLTYINLTGCNITNDDVIGLGRIDSLKTLNLKSNHNITNVAPLINVQNLNLSSCHGIVDISQLGHTSPNLKKLNLDDTKGILLLCYLNLYYVS